MSFRSGEACCELLYPVTLLTVKHVCVFGEQIKKFYPTMVNFRSMFSCVDDTPVTFTPFKSQPQSLLYLFCNAVLYS